MPSPTQRKTLSLITKSTELAVAVPQVVAHRMTRIALAGPTPAARDRQEFLRMGAEKAAAFGRSWHEMAMQAALANQALACSLLRSLWMAPRPASAAAMAARWQGSALDVLDKGLDPVHRKAVANAKRLGRTRLR